MERAFVLRPDGNTNQASFEATSLIDVYVRANATLRIPILANAKCDGDMQRIDSFLGAATTIHDFYGSITTPALQNRCSQRMSTLTSLVIDNYEHEDVVSLDIVHANHRKRVGLESNNVAYIIDALLTGI